MTEALRRYTSPQRLSTLTTPEHSMQRSILVTLITLGITLTAAPASAVVYCKTIGVPRGCVARPVSVAPVVRAPVVRAPAAAAVAAPRPGNLNGGVNRVGRWR